MPADFLTLRGEQTKLLINRPMTARNAGGMASDRVPFTTYQLFLTAEGFPAATYSLKITVGQHIFFFFILIIQFYKVQLKQSVFLPALIKRTLQEK